MIEVKGLETVKLSELPPETLLAYEDGDFQVTAADLKNDHESHDDRTWYVCTERRWQPSAKEMLMRYIETEYDEMYEDWDDRARDCLKNEHYERIQAVLDEAFAGDHATKYWMLDGPRVIID